MNRFVLDASVAAKWFLPADGEPFQTEAFGLLHQFTQAKAEFLVPDLFWPESANILWKCSRMGRITAADARYALRELRALAPQTLPSHEVVEDALRIGLATARTVYDSVYLAVAVSRNAVLVTADERLANATAARFPVRWLGAF